MRSVRQWWKLWRRRRTSVVRRRKERQKMSSQMYPKYSCCHSNFTPKKNVIFKPFRLLLMMSPHAHPNMKSKQNLQTVTSKKIPLLLFIASVVVVNSRGSEYVAERKKRMCIWEKEEEGKILLSRKKKSIPREDLKL